MIIAQWGRWSAIRLIVAYNNPEGLRPVHGVQCEAEKSCYHKAL